MKTFKNMHVGECVHIDKWTRKYARTHTDAPRHTRIRINTRTHTNKYTHAPIPIQTCTHSNIHIHPHMPTHAHTHTNTCTCPHQHRHAPVPTHAQTHTNTRTHPQTKNLSLNRDRKSNVAQFFLSYRMVLLDFIELSVNIYPDREVES